MQGDADRLSLASGKDLPNVSKEREREGNEVRKNKEFFVFLVGNHANTNLTSCFDSIIEVIVVHGLLFTLKRNLLVLFGLYVLWPIQSLRMENVLLYRV